MSWWLPYLGRPYAPDFDCLDLLELVQREVFGRELTLPIHSKSVSARARQFTAEWDDFFRPTATPTDGAAALLIARNIHQHVGVAVILNKIPHILHCARNTGTMLQSIAVLNSRYGYQLRGWYEYVQPHPA